MLELTELMHELHRAFWHVPVETYMKASRELSVMAERQGCTMNDLAKTLQGK